MLERPTPWPGASEKPRPVSATTMRTLPPAAAAVMVTLPPSRCGSRPCLIAFSTSEGSMSGGNGASRSSGGTSISKASRLPMRICRMFRYARTSSISWPTVETDSRILGRALRRYWMRWPVIALACPGSTSVNACTEASVL